MSIQVDLMVAGGSASIDYTTIASIVVFIVVDVVPISIFMVWTVDLVQKSVPWGSLSNTFKYTFSRTVFPLKLLVFQIQLTWLVCMYVLAMYNRVATIPGIIYY